jgi:hypothetical protein
VHDHRRRVDHAADQDVQAADVVQRQRAEPTVVLLHPERVRGRARAGGMVRVGQLDRLRRARGAGRLDQGVDRGWLEGRSQWGVRGRTARGGPRGVRRRSRREHRTEARQRVQQLGEAEPGRMGHPDPVTGRHPCSCELAGAAARALVELREGQRAVVGGDRHVPGPGTCCGGQPVVHFSGG